MSGCSVGWELDAGRLTCRVTGIFDRASAWEVRDRIERAGCLEVLLDFTGVRDASDLGVAVLAHGIGGTGRRVYVRGFGPRHLRIFQFCGVPVDERARSRPAPTEAAPPPDAA